jgi:nucleoid-associated protein YgaU
MFDPTSRYYQLETATFEVKDASGETREIKYKRRRMLPPPADPATTLTHIVARGERVDLIAFKYGLDPLRYWKIADANLAHRPRELTDRPGYAIRIPQS